MNNPCPSSVCGRRIRGVAGLLQIRESPVRRPPPRCARSREPAGVFINLCRPRLTAPSCRSGVFLSPSGWRLSPGAQGPRQGSRPCTLAHRHQPGVRRGPASVAHGGRVLTPPAGRCRRSVTWVPGSSASPPAPKLASSLPTPSLQRCPVAERSSQARSSWSHAGLTTGDTQRHHRPYYSVVLLLQTRLRRARAVPNPELPRPSPRLAARSVPRMRPLGVAGAPGGSLGGGSAGREGVSWGPGHGGAGRRSQACSGDCGHCPRRERSGLLGTQVLRAVSTSCTQGSHPPASRLPTVVTACQGAGKGAARGWRRAQQAANPGPHLAPWPSRGSRTGQP